MPPDHAESEAVAALRAGVTELGVSLDASQVQRLARYLSLLSRWNAVHNLTAIDSPLQAVTHHLLDCLAALPELDRFANDRPLRLIDVGSGGGLPGVPIAIARPDWSVTMVDKVGKKIAFLIQARTELGLTNLEAIHARVEALEPETRFDVVISRAFSDLSDFVRLTRNVLADGGAWFAMKGARPLAELGALEKVSPPVVVARAVKLDVPRLNAERHLFVIQPR